MSEHYYDRSDIFETSFQKVGWFFQIGKFITYSYHIKLQRSRNRLSGTYGPVQGAADSPLTGEGKNRQSNDMKAPNLYTNTLLLNPQNKRKTP